MEFGPESASADFVLKRGPTIQCASVARQSECQNFWQLPIAEPRKMDQNCQGHSAVGQAQFARSLEHCSTLHLEQHRLFCSELQKRILNRQAVPTTAVRLLFQSFRQTQVRTAVANCDGLPVQRHTVTGIGNRVRSAHNAAVKAEFCRCQRKTQRIL